MTTPFISRSLNGGAGSLPSRYLEPLLDFFRFELVIDEDEEVSPDTPLLDLGLLDSMGIVTLLAFIEESLGVDVPESAVHPRHLRDARAITAWLEGFQPTSAV